VQGANLQPAPLPTPDTAVRPAPDGSFRLEPGAPELHGGKLRVENRNNHDYLAAWDNAGDWAAWTLRAPAQATYEVNVICSTPIKDTEFIVELAGRELRGVARKTAGWYDYQTVAVGRVSLSPGAEVPLSIRAGNPAAWRAVNIRSIQLTNVK
jgi:hypothetical protein